VAAEAGVNLQTLRYYERRGLLAEPERLASRSGRYAPRRWCRPGILKTAQRLGFTLEEIDSLLDLAAGGPPSAKPRRL